MANYTTIFRTNFLQNRSIDFDKTFFVKKLKLSSFRNGMACLWSLKLVMGSPSYPLSTTVKGIFGSQTFFLDISFRMYGQQTIKKRCRSAPARSQIKDKLGSHFKHDRVQNNFPINRLFFPSLASKSPTSFPYVPRCQIGRAHV